MELSSLHELLRSTYDEMMPLAEQMSGIARGIAGLGALFYMALRVWSSLSKAEPIDVYPLLRPFVLGFCIMFFPLVLSTMNTVLSPIVAGTAQMVKGQETEVSSLRQERDRAEREALRRDPTTAFLADEAEWDKKIEEMGIIGPGDVLTIAGMYAEKTTYETKKWFMRKIKELLEVIFQASSLIIDTLRTFILIVLSILGPVVFGIAVWDGLSGSLTAWFSRYISVYLWLPVSSILTALLIKIQVLMLRLEIQELNNPDILPDGGYWFYIIFFLIGIVGYFCVPTVAGWIIEAGGGIGNYGKNVNEQAKSASSAVGSRAGAAAGAVTGHVSGKIWGKLIKK